MNLISGIYCYLLVGLNLVEVMEFFDNCKEVDELYMVVDEELKMMVWICEDGGWVFGFYFKEMVYLVYIEYFIEGQISCDVCEVLCEMLFVLIVIGSLLESVCWVICCYELQGCGYYSGVVVLIGGDGQGGCMLDLVILICIVEIEGDGCLCIGVGLIIVCYFDFLGEVVESWVKVFGLIVVLKSQVLQCLGLYLYVVVVLVSCNVLIVDFWLCGVSECQQLQVDLFGCEVLIVDVEDIFISMIVKQFKLLGLMVIVCGFQELYLFDGYDLVIMGFGLGNFIEIGQLKIGYLYLVICLLFSECWLFFVVCLSYQVLSLCLGLDL